MLVIWLALPNRKKHSPQKHMIAQDDNVAASSASDIDICEKE